MDYRDAVKHSTYFRHIFVLMCMFISQLNYSNPFHDYGGLTFASFYLFIYLSTPGCLHALVQNSSALFSYPRTKAVIQQFHKNTVQKKICMQISACYFNPVPFEKEQI